MYLVLTCEGILVNLSKAKLKMVKNRLDRADEESSTRTEDDSAMSCRGNQCGDHLCVRHTVYKPCKRVSFLTVLFANLMVMAKIGTFSLY